MRFAPRVALVAAAIGIVVVCVRAQDPAANKPDQSGLRFKSGVELINVTATVSDASGRFVPGLRKGRLRSSTKTTRRSRSRISAPSACRSASASCSTRAAAWRATRWTPRGARSTGSWTSCSTNGRRDVPLSVQQLSGAAAGLDDRSSSACSSALEPHDAERRHGDVRRGRPKRFRWRSRAAIARRRSS